MIIKLIQMILKRTENEEDPVDSLCAAADRTMFRGDKQFGAIHKAANHL